jgi:hypothetical protein
MSSPSQADAAIMSDLPGIPASQPAPKRTDWFQHGNQASKTAE